MMSSDPVSPTAHYTGYVWARNGLSHSELATREGQLLFESLRAVLAANRLLGGTSLEPYLLTRHRAIDALLQRAIDDGTVGVVIEVACGLSPRGWRFSERYGERITYIETDLPDMAERKRHALERMGSLSEHHRVEVVDALQDEGPESLDQVLATLPRDQGAAIITEGLLGYLPTDAVHDLWRRFARGLARFSGGRYLSDLHVRNVQSAQVKAFRVLLSGFVRGRVHLHFDRPADAKEALRAAGFSDVVVHPAARLASEVRGPGSGLAHVIEASV